MSLHLILNINFRICFLILGLCLRAFYRNTFLIIALGFRFLFPIIQSYARVLQSMLNIRWADFFVFRNALYIFVDYRQYYRDDAWNNNPWSSSCHSRWIYRQHEPQKFQILKYFEFPLKIIPYYSKFPFNQAIGRFVPIHLHQNFNLRILPFVTLFILPANPLFQ